MPGVIVALIILIIVALLIAVSCVKIVPQATACRCIFPDHRSETLCIWCGEPDHGDREPDCNHTA